MRRATVFKKASSASGSYGRRSSLIGTTNALERSSGLEGWHRSTRLLDSPSDRTRLFTVFALSWLRPADPEVLRALARSTDREPEGTGAYPYFLSTALGLQADPARLGVWQAKFDRVLPTLSAESFYPACQALLCRRTPAEIPRFVRLLQAPESDTRVAAAWTILDLVFRAGDSGTRVGK